MNHLAREPKKRVRKATIMVPQQTNSRASSPNNTTGNAAVVKFGSLLVDRKSSTPYSDATQVSIDFLLKPMCCVPNSLSHRFFDSTFIASSLFPSFFLILSLSFFLSLSFSLSLSSSFFFTPHLLFFLLLFSPSLFLSFFLSLLLFFFSFFSFSPCVNQLLIDEIRLTCASVNSENINLSALVSSLFQLSLSGLYLGNVVKSSLSTLVFFAAKSSFAQRFSP